MPDLTPPADLEALRKLAREARERAEAATAAPWAYNTYSGVFATAYIKREEEAWDQAPEGCNFPQRHSCSACIEDDAGMRNCASPVDLYDADSVVAWVPAAYGDTAIGRHQADAQFIAHARSDVPSLAEALERALDEVERLRGPLPIGPHGPGCECEAARWRRPC